MSDAELIYNACLRAERKLEARSRSLADAGKEIASLDVRGLGHLIAMLREEIGNGIAEKRP